MSILSEIPDGMGYYYGFLDGDHRQVNVRYEERTSKGNGHYFAYVGGSEVPAFGGFRNKAEAEAAAVAWIKENPYLDCPTYVGDE